MGIGKIQRMRVRDVWRHEAHDFTTWMEDNIDALNDAIGFELDIQEREKSVGAFSLDLLATGPNGELIIIENQFEKSNHDHLGKVLVYLTNLDAKIGIWIVEEARPEHITAISWLNESSSADFYLIKLEAIRINNSPPAPLFTLIVGPSEEIKAMGAAKKDMSEQENRFYRFWKGFIEFTQQDNGLKLSATPSKRGWQTIGTGLSGLNFDYILRKGASLIDLYFTTSDADLNLERFKFFEQHKAEIENSFDGELIWFELEGKISCKIRATSIDKGFTTPEEEWQTIYKALTETSKYLSKAIDPIIAKLKADQR